MNIGLSFVWGFMLGFEMIYPPEELKKEFGPRLMFNLGVISIGFWFD
jgi:hypothetical protein